MALKRPLLVITGGALTLILASLGALAYLRLRTGPLAEQLVRDANALAQARYPRPAHVTPAEPGTFGERLEPLIPELRRVHQQGPSLGDGTVWETCREGADGQRPLDVLPPVCLESLERGRDVMRRVLAATHAEAGGLPAGLGLLAVEPGLSWTPTRSDSVRRALRHVLRLGALETRRLLGAGQIREALDTCLDTLALSRDLALGGAFDGQRTSAEGYDAAWKPCAAALDAAPLELKREAAARIARVGEGFPPFSLTLKEQSVLVGLGAFHTFLSADQVAALPPLARPAPVVPPDTVGMWPELVDPVYSRLVWRQFAQVHEQLTASADLPSRERRKAFAALEARLATRELGVPRQVGDLLAAVAAEATALADTLDLRRLQSDALLALAEVDAVRAEQGQWPKAPPREVSSLVLESSGPGETILKPCASSLSRYALRITADPPGNLQAHAP